MDVDRLRVALAGLELPRGDGQPRLAVDVTPWPRPDAKCSRSERPHIGRVGVTGCAGTASDGTSPLTIDRVMDLADLGERVGLQPYLQFYNGFLEPDEIPEITAAAAGYRRRHAREGRR